ncbi:insecticidal delta-endotoxin Cry8Ea1 family protein, partial [Bacillus wiedmannii]|uniref:insecticidal delta-endotoxin Cry8Ea1 family protein n=1 Tax=Bacillus wiedmannii TaxID=1890302 RepID=UPI003D2401AD
MNQYEILDNGDMGYQSRYPLAQAPGSEFQQMNYKDWLNRCAVGESGELFGDSNALRDGTVTSVTILSVILSVSFPVASAAVGIIAVVLPFLWPEQAGTPGTSEAQFTWEQLMDAVEELINNAIATEAKRDAIDALENLQTSVNDYYRAVCNLKTDPDMNSYKERVRITFIAVDQKARDTINRLNDNPPTHAVQFLPSYAQAANLHLLLLRDVVQYGESWGFTAVEVQQYFSNTTGVGNPGMLQLLAIYTDYCVRWYNTGLRQQYDTGDWNKFNNFRRDMTIMVLDIVSLWQTYNPKLYAVPTKSQLTRTVYTPLLGFTDPYGTGFTPIQVIEAAVTDVPRLFTWLRELSIDKNIDPFPGRPIEPSQPGYFTGRRIVFQNTLDSTLFEGGYRGNPGELRETLTIPSPELGDDVWRITTKDTILSALEGRDIKSWSFSLTKSPDQSLYGGTYSTNSVLTGLPCNNSVSGPCNPCNPCRIESPNMNVPCNDKNLYSHRFSYMGAGTIYVIGKNYLAYFSYGWTHVSADANNLIDPEKITQIPAVKGSSIWNGATVIKGPGSTGGDLVQLPIRTSMHLEVTLPAFDEDIVASYSVRIRYASSQSTNLGVQFEGEIEQGSRLVELPATYSGGDLTYNTFGYQFALGITSHSESQRGTIILNHVGPSGPNIIIDKIEFVPQKVSVTEYEANQNVEKARKTVNALFTNDAKNT